MEINDKVAIVTGGNGGIGFATVQSLLRNGAKYVAILDLLESNVESVISNLKKLEEEFNAEKFGYYICDVTNHDAFTACYKKVTALQSYVDILVNNAGSGAERRMDFIIDVNFRAVIKCTMLALNYMGTRQGGRGGVIVNISSFLGLMNTPIAPLYNATKHAVVSFVRSMKEHNKKFGVRIVCVCPGMTKTNMVEANTIRASLFDFIGQEVIDELLAFYTQKPDNVAAAIVEIVRRGEDGAVWVSQNDEPAFAVGDMESIEKSRIPF